MHILALVRGHDHVCCRYRLAAYRDHLEGAGHTLTLRTWCSNWWHDRNLALDLKRADAVILQRILLPFWQLDWLRQHARYLIYDFDDAVYLRDSYSWRGLRSLRRLRRFTRIVQAADTLVAGNSFLAEQAAQLASSDTLTAERVHVIPTCVDPAIYQPAAHAGTGPTTLVWIGSTSTLASLRRIRPWLEELGKTGANLRLKVICDRTFRLRHLPVDFHPWSKDCETRELTASDIGISWLPDDDWSRGKCALKVLQYLAAGLPVVANPVGVQAELVQPNVTGVWATQLSDWRQAILELAAQPWRRQQLGEAGRLHIQKHYSVSEGARRWLDLLNKLPAPRHHKRNGTSVSIQTSEPKTAMQRDAGTEAASDLHRGSCEEAPTLVSTLATRLASRFTSILVGKQPHE